ncbi:hypothetical protein EJ070_19710 [Mesorhizobium sp. M1E.F.Ca.ET.045.02.1.1]|uniref:hydantoinase B/oxoprolinase family protein n=1 Tax=Mesorhizobium sp. M1E.F.Ca.ET.045.02.1.1 TaxID=2493672 RepID=UPI000F758901|nr:hydantoinase B/oxoprolinase family protein [Mesorhizobium sp. M1E.F.Ca.ET.045.02.1.1]AZO22671.1 hypothetical protein EJ070_19710 [Mesorhizobium sp. M1E.F.Ca.ET.045.02.1.1]
MLLSGVTISIITPVFVGGKISTSSATSGHHSDVGGVVPGSTDYILTSVFAEGIRILHMRIVGEDVLDEEPPLHDRAQHAGPMECIFDLKVQIVANKSGRAEHTSLGMGE